MTTLLTDDEIKALQDIVRDFLNLAPPSMTEPYKPQDYDEWRILRKDARVALDK